MNVEELEHTEKFKYLIGKKIEEIRYMTEEEMKEWGWYKRPLIIFFTDNSFIIPQSDDEGNNGGALFYSDKKREDIIYVL
tara:strand:- start:14787 stop:15026 length:240 start_codon:yes stop_codon:yes gene_type:complete